MLHNNQNIPFNGSVLSSGSGVQNLDPILRQIVWWEIINDAVHDDDDAVHDDGDDDDEEEMVEGGEKYEDDEHHIGLNGVVALGHGGGDNRMG